MKPQEQEGDYFFNGGSYVTNNVATELTKEEIAQIVGIVFDYVKQHNGADYLFVFEHQTDQRKIYVIDQLSKSMMDDPEAYTPEDVKEYNYFTILYSWEY